MKITVVGLGKLGSCHAALLASKGYEVIGSDINDTIVNDINNTKAPFLEQDLQDVMNKAGNRLSATINTIEAVSKSDVTFVIVPTPSEISGRFSMQYVLKVASDIGKGLKNNPNYHVVVLVSTVMPNDTDSKFIPALEKASGKKFNNDFGVCYNPEFIALGSIIKNMLYPDIVLIGESSVKAGDIIQKLYEKIISNNSYFARMNIINAELTKISINTYITTKISYANMISQICNNLKNTDANIVLNAVGQDSRIGTKYLKPGLPFGGPCFPRDNVALTIMAENLGINPILAKATTQMNNSHIEFINRIIEQKLQSSDQKVALLGLSYKPNTPVIEHSPAIAIAKNLIEKNFTIYAFDPQAIENAKKEEIGDIYFVNNIESAIKDADLIIIATAWNEFKNLSPNLVKENACVIDCWGILDSNEWGNKLTAIGKNQYFKKPRPSRFS